MESEPRCSIDGAYGEETPRCFPMCSAQAQRLLLPRGDVRGILGPWHCRQRGAPERGLKRLWLIGDVAGTRWCPSSLAKLVNITPITMVYGRYNYS